MAGIRRAPLGGGARAAPQCCWTIGARTTGTAAGPAPRRACPKMRRVGPKGRDSRRRQPDSLNAGITVHPLRGPLRPHRDHGQSSGSLRDTGVTISRSRVQKALLNAADRGVVRWGRIPPPPPDRRDGGSSYATVPVEPAEPLLRLFGNELAPGRSAQPIAAPGENSRTYSGRASTACSPACFVPQRNFATTISTSKCQTATGRCGN